MKTNDRRKTFNTPLEFWQWAIMQPGKRLASSKTEHGLRYLSVEACKKTGVPTTFWVTKGINVEYYPVTHDDFPLTAVEDEHGVIGDDATQDYLTCLEAAVDIIRTPATATDSNEAYINTSVGLIVDAIRQIADERIAAATVEYKLSTEEWAIKPKGES